MLVGAALMTAGLILNLSYCRVWMGAAPVSKRGWCQRLNCFPPASAGARRLKKTLKSPRLNYCRVLADADCLSRCQMACQLYLMDRW